MKTLITDSEIQIAVDDSIAQSKVVIADPKALAFIHGYFHSVFRKAESEQLKRDNAARNFLNDPAT